MAKPAQLQKVDEWKHMNPKKYLKAIGSNL
jgi:hypothetical protein